MSCVSPKELVVREALFRQAMSPGLKGCTWFIDFGHDEPEDPPDEFLARFTDVEGPVRKVSQCRRNEQSCVWDPESGNQGFIVKARLLRWLDERTAEVEYSDWHGMEAGGGGSGRAILNARGDKCVLQIDEHWRT